VTDLAHLDVHADDARCVLEIQGEIDISNAKEMGRAMEAAIPNGAPLVVIDLTRTTYLDSAGIQLLFRIADRLHERRQRLRLVVPTGSPIRKVLELTGIHRLIPLIERVDEA
jgi:anti-sigma B factor antagonist